MSKIDPLLCFENVWNLNLVEVHVFLPVKATCKMTLIATIGYNNRTI